MKREIVVLVLAGTMLVGCSDGEDNSPKTLKATSETTCADPGNSRVVSYVGKFLDQAQSQHNNSFHIVEWVGWKDNEGNIALQRKSCGAETCTGYETLKLRATDDSLPEFVSLRRVAQSYNQRIDMCFRDVVIAVQDWDEDGIISGTISGTSSGPDAKGVEYEDAIQVSWPNIFWVDMNVGSSLKPQNPTM